MAKLFGILLVLILVLGGLYAFTMRAPATGNTVEGDVRALVEDFGSRLKNVSLLATEADLEAAMEREYGPLVASALIETWLADPQNAPGRLTSSPWPERIEVASVVEAGGAYRVEGDIVEVTSEGGGIGEESTEALRRPVTIEVSDTADGLRITAVTLGAYPGDGDWILSAANAQGIRYMYPADLPTTYISPSDWPPLVERTANAYSCTEGPVTAADGPLKEMERRVLGDREYCVTVSSEGAAGSTYRMYEYSFVSGSSTYRVVFTLRYPQCANYDEPQRATCEREQASYDVDGLVDRIASSIRAG